MSAFPPPNVYFNGIIYDSQFFEIPALTLSQANAKYLQKTISDTATALETFTGGIVTNTINGTSATASPNVYQNTTSGTFTMLGAQVGGALTIAGSTSRTGGVTIANGTRGDISIGNAMNTGTNIIRIGTTNRGTLSLRGTDVKVGEGGGSTVELATTSTTSMTAFKPFTVGYSYPVSTPSQIGWMQSRESGFTLTFDTVDRCNGCNATAMVQGIYAMKFFIYSPNGNIPSGGNLLCVLMGSNSSKASGALVSAGDVIDPNGGTYGWYLERKISGTAFGIDATINFTFIINNTNAGGSQFLPFMFITAKASLGTSAGNMASATYTRIA
jgi:hypothetical protein